MILSSTAALNYVPKRIVSLVPSQTELLYHLDLDIATVGITKFCIYPTLWYHNKLHVGGTKTFDIQKIMDLKPDLIIANKEENLKDQVMILAKYFPVWVTNVNSLKDALEMINDIGQLTGKQQKAIELANKIEANFSVLKNKLLKKSAAYLIWKNPYMTIGADTFIHDMMNKAGFKNVFSDKKRYPSITMDDLKKSNCEYLLLSSEPYPFKQKHIIELQQELKQVKIMLVNGEMFSWYGSRLLQSPRYFKKLMNTIYRELS
jgi:ABC-type Fe3+-hydroxamate transport system substrate-binding protein